MGGEAVIRFVTGLATIVTAHFVAVAWKPLAVVVGLFVYLYLEAT